MNQSVDVNHLCMGCMSPIERKDVPCTSCGWMEGQNIQPLHPLPLQTILNGKYLVGRVLGEGGFGITYLGWDLNLDMKVAIKEYYPSGFVTRENLVTASVTPFIGDRYEAFISGLDKFVGEAKSLAKFYNLPGIVSVKDFFKENGTAYIVMEYIEGVTLKNYLKEQGGRLSSQHVEELAKPLIRSLSRIHEAGLIHRDISPDNIMLTKEGDIKLLDFGAARNISSDGAKSLSVLLKPGYAPEEQYRTRGRQGPWTDVYALCATLYKMITGETPPESMERMREDLLVPPSRMGVTISTGFEACLLKGLAVFQENRYQSMGELYDALIREESKTRPIENTGLVQPNPLGGQKYDTAQKISPDYAMRPLPEDRIPQSEKRSAPSPSPEGSRPVYAGKYASDYVMRPLPEDSQATHVKKAAPIQYFAPKQEEPQKPNQFAHYVLKPLDEPEAASIKENKKKKGFFGSR